jgi:hypothetical protein
MVRLHHHSELIRERIHAPRLRSVSVPTGLLFSGIGPKLSNVPLGTVDDLGDIPSRSAFESETVYLKSKSGLIREAGTLLPALLVDLLAFLTDLV